LDVHHNDALFWCLSAIESTQPLLYPNAITIYGVFGMFDPKIFDDLSRKLVDGLPSGFKAFQSDLERNIKASLESALRQMNLVSRDEFEIQQAILMRTREKVDALEKRVAELETQLSS
jgi:BMFP domain-containing protein YqiC